MMAEQNHYPCYGCGEKINEPPPSSNYTSVIWFSVGNIAIVGDNDPQYNVPVSMEKYSKEVGLF